MVGVKGWLLRAGLLAAGAAAASFAFATIASAEEAEAASAAAPTPVVSMNLPASSAPPALPGWLAEGSALAEALAVEEPAALGAEAMESAEAMLAEEQVVQPVVKLAPQVPVESPSALERALGTLRAGSEQVGSFLGRALTVCQVGLGSGAGGPVLLLGVLGLTVALARHRVLGIRGASDENVPRFLYAWELTPPG